MPVLLKRMCSGPLSLVSDHPVILHAIAVRFDVEYLPAVVSRLIGGDPARQIVGNGRGIPLPERRIGNGVLILVVDGHEIVR
ncbi:MAG: hypothetical protein ACUVRS_09095 [Armatimonadota bacterium]